LIIRGKYLKSALKRAELTQIEAANKLGIARQTLINWMNFGELNPEIVQNVKERLGIDLTKQEENNNLLNEPEVKYMVTKVVEAETSPGRQVNLERFLSPGFTPIPVYDNTGDVEHLSDLLNNRDIKPVVLIMKGHLGCDIIVRHNDKAMDKVFPPKCQLGIQRVNNFKRRIIPGMAAIIVLEDFTITRYVHTAPDDHQLLFKSADPEGYPDMIVSKEEIKEMWKIKSFTREALSEIMMY
jgi:transcriptional regulator with XRE-family HTH domain